MMSTQSTLFAVDGLASPTVLRERGSQAKMSVTSGQKSSECFAKYVPGFGWAKTFGGYLQASLDGSFQPYSETWPTSGLMHDGECMLHQTWVPRIKENGHSSWRTPQAYNGNQGPKSREFYERCLETSESAITLVDQVRHAMWPTPTAALGNGGGDSMSREKFDEGKQTVSLQSAIKMWPTPQAHDSQGGSADRIGRHGTKHGDRNLSDWVHLRPTPQSRDYRSGDALDSQRAQRKQYEGWSANLNDAVLWPTVTVGDSKSARNSTANRKKIPPTGVHTGDTLTDAITKSESKGQLNPDWVETLMDYPIGWTDAEVENADLRRVPWPAGYGQYQHPWEPTRTTTKKQNRAARLKALGNAVVPKQAAPVFAELVRMASES